MKSITRVHALDKIPVLNDKGHQVDVVQVAGRIALPLSIEIPRKGAVGCPDRYFLSLTLGELVYLHEQVPVA